VADGGIKTDGSPSAIRPEPKNKLSVAEREHLLAMINNADFKSMPASQILPTLADEGFIHA
jgi:putative transposase